MSEFFIILLALSGWRDNEAVGHSISKAALDFSQKVYTEFSTENQSILQHSRDSLLCQYFR